MNDFLFAIGCVFFTAIVFICLIISSREHDNRQKFTKIQNDSIYDIWRYKVNRRYKK